MLELIRYSVLNLFAMITTVGLVSILCFLTTLPGQFIIAAPSIGSLDFAIQSNGDTSGYIVCDPNCHIVSNNSSNNTSSSNSSNNNSVSNRTEAQPSYGLT